MPAWEVHTEPNLWVGLENIGGADKACFRDPCLGYGNCQVEVSPQFPVLDTYPWMSHPHNPNYSCSSHSILFLITSVRTHPSLHYYSSDLIFLPDQPSGAAHFITFLISVWSFNLSPFSPPPLTWSPYHFCVFLTWPPCHHSNAHWSFSLPPRCPLSSHLIMWLSCWNLFLAPLVQGWRH